VKFDNLMESHLNDKLYQSVLTQSTREVWPQTSIFKSTTLIGLTSIRSY